MPPSMFQRRRGFTLVEAVVYLFILALLSVVVVTLLVNIVRAFYRARAFQRVGHSAEVVLGRFSREVRRATTVDLINSALGAHPGTLSLNTTDELGGPDTVKFYLANGAVMITETDGSTATSTDSNVAVGNLVFRYFNGAGGELVRVELTLTDSAALPGRDFKFYDTAVLRGGY